MLLEMSSSRKWALLLYSVLCLPLLLLIGLTLYGAYSDRESVRSSTLRREIGTLRSQATRQIGHLEMLAEMNGGDFSWEAVKNDPQIAQYWQGANAHLSDHQLYSAIVDESGTIVLHSNRALEGKDLSRRWYERTVPEAGADVVQLTASDLSGRQPAFDVRIPVTVHGHVVGDYHEGLDARWLEGEIATLQRETLRSWAWVIALVGVVDVAAASALVLLLRRHQQLQSMVFDAAYHRASELSQLAAGLAHEIRNPLHALRINLYALRRGLNGPTKISQEDLSASIEESNNAIDGLERLMRDLLRFTTAEGAQRTEVNLVGELQATLNLINEDMRHREIEVEASYPQQPVPVVIDPSRLRQMLLNVLTFAQSNIGAQGKIDVALVPSKAGAEIVVADSGPTLGEKDRSHLFEPFQGVRETGSGLGLALVKTFIEEVGGTVVCERKLPTGNRFRLVLPLSNTAR